MQEKRADGEMTGDGPLIGEALPLDLVNTRPAGRTGRTDLIGTAAQLTAWLAAQAERLPAEVRGLAPGPADLAAVHAVRADTEAVAQALLAGRRPPRSALQGLTAAQGGAPAIRELDWEDGELTVTPRRSGTPGAVLAAVFAEAAVALLSGPDVRKVKECEAEDCVMLFLPAHPRRRWCSPARCGNRARVARYYQRHKSAHRTPDGPGHADGPDRADGQDRTHGPGHGELPD
ncbi:CGNR zinc finger domain-containing protein [Streptomyces indicus]|uniref:Conserved protein containing a Zn-ribbon-like motif, possibly RNA-binding n=1 Tax=Streptomyces indicus TaxID=417292 RepID=A0A1G9JIJ0_9ACTN|nr:CGNR zinc finger domain-containing protein [Streptomyces indicus]SDL37075.1 Conserved protein containing a Zn-ribbon-like motif, possibly RNA-binding [Streptomyces indicus]